MASSQYLAWRVRLVRLLLLASLGTATGLGVLLACGPDFPSGLLADREGVLDHAPEATFSSELRGLIATPADLDRLKPVEGVSYDSDGNARDSQSELSKLEVDGLTETQRVQVRDMRRLSDGEAAFGAGDALPAEVRQYTAGAVSFRNQQLDSARTHFAAVLALPESERQRRELWARYMLGRVASLQRDEVAAAAHFESTRALVRRGVADPLGLAVASFGEEARLFLRQGTIAKAIQLYLQQSAYGSDSGVASLLRVARQVLDNPALLDEAVQDPTTRRLLFVYLSARVYTRVGYLDSPADTDPDRPDPNPNSDPDPNAAPPDPADPRDDADRDATAAANPPETARDPLDRILAALERHRIVDREGIGWLAACAYQTGRFDLAQRLAEGDTTTVGTWIRAKLAWRRGDAASAISEYAKAVSTLRNDEREGSLAAELMAESALAELGRDQFAQALDMLFDAHRRVVASEAYQAEWRTEGSEDYWMDVAYVAERLLTLDELKRYVDDHVKTPTPADVEAALEEGRTLPEARLRGLLGRRLMRAGNHAQALSYFDDEHIRSVAEEYVSTLARANNWWRRHITRAEAWYLAATIARFDGLEFLGYELSPDYAVFDGQFSLDAEGEFEEPPVGAEPGTSASDKPPQPGGDERGKPAAITAGAPTAAEKRREQQSIPKPAVRFQYRLTAIDHAMKAADLLPTNSQAFAAVLCRSTSWVLDREPEEAARIYARYLKEGPHVVWARAFGRRCPQPDFKRAGTPRWVARLGSLWNNSPTIVLAAGPAGVAVIALSVVVVRLRRRRREATADIR